jgi:hypothetical protein
MYKNKFTETKQDITSLLIQKLNDYGVDDYNETEDIPLDELLETTVEIISEIEDVRELQAVSGKLKQLYDTDMDTMQYREQLSGILIEALLIV